MITNLLDACNRRFISERHNKACPNCKYTGYCPNTHGECESCLELVHYPSRLAESAPTRKYDCTHMADFYVCKYAHKYVSELIYAFNMLRDLRTQQNINVLSFGCGPCTDLMALEYLRQTGAYNYTTLEYRGIDYGKDVWGNIHKDIKNACSNGTQAKFAYEDAREVMGKLTTNRWIPNLVVFQYFFSDMYKNAETSEITSFINSFADYANTKMPENSYIVLNDINLSTRYKGGREYFDKLLAMMNNCHHRRWYFHNNNAGRSAYPYGTQFDNNSLFFNDISAYEFYNPYNSCSSAQMLIKKGGETA